VNPASIIAGQYEGRYIASFEQVEYDGTVGYGALIMDATGQTPFLIRTNVRASAFHYDIPTGSLYFVFGNDIYQWEAPDAPLLTMEWKSQKYVYPLPVSFSAIRVDTDDIQTPEDIEAALELQAEVLAYNTSLFNLATVGGELNGAAIGEYTVNGSMLKALPLPYQIKTAAITVFADTEPVLAFTELNDIVRLPAVKARRWEIMVGGTTSIKDIAMATSVAELSGVG
jgi:hypothetical protein